MNTYPYRILPLWTQGLIIGILLLVAMSMGLLLPRMYQNYSDYDDFISISIAEKFSERGLWSSQEILRYYPALYSLILFGLKNAFSDDYMQVARTLNLFLYVSIPLLLVLVSRKFLAVPWIFLPSLFFILNPQLAFLSASLNPLFLTIVLSLLGLMTLDAIDEMQGTYIALICGFFWGMVFLLEPLIAVFPLCLMSIYAAWKRNYGVILRYIIISLAAILVVSPWLYRNFQVEGSVCHLTWYYGVQAHAGHLGNNYKEAAQVLSEVSGSSGDAEQNDVLSQKEREFSLFLRSDLKSFTTNSFTNFFNLWAFVIPEKAKDEQGFGILREGAALRFSTSFWILLYLIVQLLITCMAVWAYNLRGLVRELGGAYPFIYHSFSWFIVFCYSVIGASPFVKLYLFPIFLLFATVSLYYLFLISRVTEPLSRERLMSCIFSMFVIPAILFHKAFFTLIQFLLSHVM